MFWSNLSQHFDIQGSKDGLPQSYHQTRLPHTAAMGDGVSPLLLYTVGIDSSVVNIYLRKMWIPEENLHHSLKGIRYIHKDIRHQYNVEWHKLATSRRLLSNAFQQASTPPTGKGIYLFEAFRAAHVIDHFPNLRKRRFVSFCSPNQCSIIHGRCWITNFLFCDHDLKALFCRCWFMQRAANKAVHFLLNM